MANIAMPAALLQDLESEEELDDIPADEKEADPLRHARIKRLIDGTEFIGEVEDIECGRVTRERVYRVRYPDGDLEHMTEEQLREVLLEEEPKKVAVPSVSAGATGKEQEPEAEQRPEKRPLPPTKKAEQEQESEAEQRPEKKQLTTKAERKQEPEAEQRPEKKPPAKKEPPAKKAESKAGGPPPKGGQGQGAAKSKAKDSAPKGGQGQGSAKAKDTVKSTAVLKKPSGK